MNETPANSQRRLMWYLPAATQKTASITANITVESRVCFTSASLTSELI